MSQRILDSVWRQRFCDVHGDFYQYSKTQIQSARTKIPITCRYHGTFEQTPIEHWRGKGCNKCAIERNRGLRSFSEDDLALIRQEYPSGDLKALASAVNRSPGVVQYAAQRMGVLRGKPKPFAPAYSIENDNLLKQLYPTASWSKLQNAFPTRSKQSIEVRANKLGLKRPKRNCAYRLLENTNEAMYWIGFLFADGHFGTNIRLSIADLEHLEKFAQFVGGSVHRLTKNKNYFGDTNDNNKPMGVVAVQDKKTSQKLKERFAVVPRKTYQPPVIPEDLSQEQLLAMFAGLIDGDGSISHYQKHNTFTIRLLCHISWRPFFEDLLQRLGFMIRATMPEIKESIRTTKGSKKPTHSMKFNCSTMASRQLAELIIDLNLPLLERKWVDLNLELTAKERSAQLRSNILKGVTDGKNSREIALENNVNPNYISQVTLDNGMPSPRTLKRHQIEKLIIELSPPGKSLKPVMEITGLGERHLMHMKKRLGLCRSKPQIYSLSKEQLQELIWTKSIFEIEKEFQTSHHTINKYCERLHISKPPNGYWQKGRPKLKRTDGQQWAQPFVIDNTTRHQ